MTKVPYHISFEKVLRSFVDPLYRDTASCTLTRDDLVRLEGILRMTPMRPAASPTAPMMIDVKGVACSIPQPETINWELAYGARCLEVDMAPLFTHLQPSNVIRLYTHIMLERYVCVGLVGRSVGRSGGRLLVQWPRLTSYVTVPMYQRTCRTVLIVSSRHDLLFHCMESLKALIFPLSWNHLYVPVMPMNMIDRLQVPAKPAPRQATPSYCPTDPPTHHQPTNPSTHQTTPLLSGTISVFGGCDQV